MIPGLHFKPPSDDNTMLSLQGALTLARQKCSMATCEDESVPPGLYRIEDFQGQLYIYASRRSLEHLGIRAAETGGAYRRGTLVSLT